MYGLGLRCFPRDYDQIRRGSALALELRCPLHGNYRREIVENPYRLETNMNRSSTRRSLWIASGFIALLLSGVFHLYAEDRRAEVRIVKSQQEKQIRNSEPSLEPDHPREPMGLIGPSGQEIHDFLYPPSNGDDPADMRTMLR
jgi:hypothetical protein